MKRFALEKLREWKDKANRQPLIIRGARQVGKTWLMKEFGRTCFEKVAYVNFDSNTRMQQVFEGEISLHSSVDYNIYMLGFLPGFPYLGGLDPKLFTPRLDNPRTRIPEGSVGIGGEQTGIYPLESPGGWRLIGRTPLKLYDPDREQPFLYQAGDYIRFVPITAEEYEAYL